MIGIVGAGITGLALHHHLRQRGVESVVFEASDRPGGAIRSVRERGPVLDCGPQRTRRTPAVSELIDTVGLEEQVIEAADVPLYVAHGGDLKLAPLSVRGAIATDLFSWRGKLRILLEPLTGPPREGESVEAYLTRTFGREFAARFGGPLYAGLYGSDPAEMPVAHSLAHALDRFGVDRSVLLAALGARLWGRSPPPAISFERGLQELPRALCEAYSDAIRLRTPVREIRASSEGYELVTDAATEPVSDVVLTTPAPVAASLLEGVDPDAAAGLAGLTYNPLAVVHLAADERLIGAGHQVPFGEPCVTLGATWNCGLFDREDRAGVYTCYLGGAKTPTALDWSDEELGDVAAREFEAVTGLEAEPIRVTRLTPGMPAYDGSWDALDRVDPPPGIRLCANYNARAGIPGRVRQAKRIAAELGAGATGRR